MARYGSTLTLALLIIFGVETSRVAGADNSIACIIKVQNDVLIPAEVPGVLMKLPLKEGARVKKGDLLATIDDREAQAGYEVAEITHQAAKKRADSDIEVRYADMASKVAKVDWDQAIAANEEHKGAVADEDLRRKKLDYQRLELQIKKAMNDGVLAQFDVKVKAAELQAAKMAVERRQIRAPFDGEIVTLYPQEAEWLSPGDPILRLVRFDTLDVEGYVSYGQYDPEQVDGRPVTIRVELAKGREVEAKGKIVYVSQLVQYDGEYKYLIRAEVPNQREGKHWLIRPGLETKMTIHLSDE